MKKIIIAAVLSFTILCSYSSAEDPGKGSVPAGTGIGQMPQVKEVTRLGNTPLLTQYMPLDKGSVWTYEIKKNSGISEHTQKIVSESGGWSIFDNYFGKEDTALRLTPDGELLVTSGGNVSSFYTEEIKITLPEDPVVTPSGKFKDAMVITNSNGDNFWFRDIYLKGVGLVYHEHKTPEGHTTFTLKSAEVGGRNYLPEKR